MAAAALVIASPSMAWQLQPLSLADRVKESSVIVVAEPAAVLERKRSLVAGAGEELLVRLRVRRVIKGTPPEPVIARFIEASVQTPPGFALDGPRVWLLVDTAGPELLAPAWFESVLSPSLEPTIRVLVDK